MFRQFMPTISKFFGQLLLSIGLLVSTPLIYAQQNSNPSSDARLMDQVYQVLAAEIAIQRGEIGSAYQIYLGLAKSSKDPRMAQRAMEIAIAGNSRPSSLEAVELWDSLSPPNDHMAREVLITLYMLNNKWPESIEPTVDYLKKLKPQAREKFLIQLLPILNRANNEDDAVNAFSKIIGALKPLPNNSELLILYALGLEKDKQYVEMEKVLRAVIKAHPNDKNALNALGYSFADRNINLQEAYALISKAVRLSPQDAYILDSLGWVEFRMGQRDWAINHLKQALEMKPQAEMATHLGEVYWSMGDQENAEFYWKKAQELNPNDATLQETLKRLRPDWQLPSNFDQTIKRRWDGRFAIKVNGQNSQDGGSGAFSLDHDASSDTLEIRGPLGISIAKVNVGPSGASLEHNGKISSANDADTLIQNTLGMPIPARGLSAWLAGYMRPGSNGKIERNGQGLVSKIFQDGWTLTYSWSNDSKLEKLKMNRQSEQGDVDIRLVFDYTNE